MNKSCPHCKSILNIKITSKFTSDPHARCPKCGNSFVIRVEKRDKFRKPINGQAAIATKPILNIREAGIFRGELWDISLEGACINLPLKKFPSVAIKPKRAYHLLFYLPLNEKPIITKGTLRWLHKDVALEKVFLGFHLNMLEDFQKEIIAKYLNTDIP